MLRGVGSGEWRVESGADLVVHTAGPFQRKNCCAVLEAAIDTKVPYLGCHNNIMRLQRQAQNLKATNYRELFNLFDFTRADLSFTVIDDCIL